METRPHHIRDEIAGVFLARHAIYPEDAIAFAPQGESAARSFDRLRTRGILREAGAGRYYFDLAAHHARAERQRRIMVPTAIIGAVLVAVIATLFYRG